MTIPAIRVAVTPDGNIEATAYNKNTPSAPFRLVIDRRDGNVIEANVREGSDMFRWLVRAAREHAAP